MSRNLLLGCGENLVTDLPRPKGHPQVKNHPYTDPEEVYSRLRPQMNDAYKYVSNLASEYCPEDNAVFRIDLHPAYLAKSYFPGRILSAFDLHVVGSKFVQLVPKKRIGRRRDSHDPISTVELYVAGTRKNIELMHNHLFDGDWFDEVRRIERIRAFTQGERIIGNQEALECEDAYELVLHSDRYDEVIVHAFAGLAKKVGINVLTQKRIQTSGLCFLPLVSSSFDYIKAIEPFAFLRLVRSMPQIRDVTRETAGVVEPISLPTLPACPPDGPKVAVFDVGCDVAPQLNGWVTKYYLKNQLPSQGVRHGTMVNSAVLFGPMGKSLPLNPVAHVDSYQVVDPADRSNKFKLYEALDRICQILDTKDYDFANLSIGPDLPIDDNDVHAWTARLDEKLASGRTLMSVAVGNNGAQDRESGNARVQVPGDSVNALCVGASTASGDSPIWDRAPYSAIGPGRMPGRIKPDVLDFGGCANNAFGVIDPVGSNLIYSMGTSFASPNALHKCIALKKKYPDLSPLAIKALMVHTASRKSRGHCDEEHGHGALPSDLDKYVVCGKDEMTVVYQGRLDPKKYVRAEIPVPQNLSGRIMLRATLCYATNVDSETPGNYTQRAIEVTLRPTTSKKTKDGNRPSSKPFFEHAQYESEASLREYGLKWDTVMQGEKHLVADKSVSSPFFELHYVAREGMKFKCDAGQVPYALVVTIRAPKTPDIYEQVVERYKLKIRPIVEVGVPVPVVAGSVVV